MRFLFSWFRVSKLNVDSLIFLLDWWILFLFLDDVIVNQSILAWRFWSCDWALLSFWWFALSIQSFKYWWHIVISRFGSVATVVFALIGPHPLVWWRIRLAFHLTPVAAATLFGTWLVIEPWFDVRILVVSTLSGSTSISAAWLIESTSWIGTTSSSNGTWPLGTLVQTWTDLVVVHSWSWSVSVAVAPWLETCSILLATFKAAHSRSTCWTFAGCVSIETLLGWSHIAGSGSAGWTTVVATVVASIVWVGAFLAVVDAATSRVWVSSWWIVVRFASRSSPASATTWLQVIEFALSCS